MYNSLSTLIILSIVIINCTLSRGYLSIYDPDFERKHNNLLDNYARVDKFREEMRNNPQKYSFGTTLNFISQINQLDMTRPDALDDVKLLTKNSLYRYRVNRTVLESVQYQIKRLRGKSLRIYEASDQFARKLMKIMESPVRRSYIVTDSDYRQSITFSRAVRST